GHSSALPRPPPRLARPVIEGNPCAASPRSASSCSAPYEPPPLAKGERTNCFYCDALVVVTNGSDGRISWPRCRAIGHRGGSRLRRGGGGMGATPCAAPRRGAASCPPPQAPPPLAKGERTNCFYCDALVVVTNGSDGRISWPRCRAIGHRGGSGLLVEEELA